MSWEQFVHIGTTIIYWSVIWFLVAIPAAVLVYGIGRIAPSKPADAAARLMAHRPAPSNATAKFQSSRAHAAQHLSLGTVRILLDGKHAKLKRELAQMRTTIDRRLQQITRASKSTNGESLLDLLVSFREDTGKALDFDQIDPSTVEKSVVLAKARSKFFIFCFATFAVSIFNLGLLYLFFDETFGGLTLPYLGIEIALLVAIFLPVLETGSGWAAEAIKDKDDSSSVKFVKSVALILPMFALAALEYYIFYKLLEGGFKGQLDFSEGSLLHMSVALVGPALTVFQATCGYGIANELDRIKEHGTVFSIQQQVARAKKFVDGLEGRYDRIEEAAARAAESLDEFAAQVKGRGEAEQPAVSLLADERKRFMEAMDAVNPNRWAREIAPSDGDVNAVTAYAWFLPVGVAFVLGIFAFVFAPAIQSSGLFPSNSMLAVGLSLLTGLTALFAGGALFDRASSAIEYDSTWKDVFAPRDGAFKVLGIIALLAVSFGIVWICFAAHGWVGIAEAALLIGILAGICWASSYIDLMLRGLTFLGAVIGSAIVWLFQVAGWFAWVGLLLLVTAIVVTILFLLQVIAWPVTWLKSQFTKERSSSQFMSRAS